MEPLGEQLGEDLPVYYRLNASSDLESESTNSMKASWISRWTVGIARVICRRCQPRDQLPLFLDRFGDRHGRLRHSDLTFRPLGDVAAVWSFVQQNISKHYRLSTTFHRCGMWARSSFYVSLSAISLEGRLRALPADVRKILQPMEQIKAQFAKPLSHSSYNLHTTKRENDALVEYEEVRALRGLCTYDHPAHQADLSRALNNLGNAFNAAGCHGDACSANQEAVAL